MRLFLVVMVGMGCSGGKGQESCDSMTEGPWTMDGSCIGMTMPAQLTLQDDGCSFVLADWTMVMDVPAGGTVSGSDVMLTGDGWTECTGTLSGDSVEGTCPDDCDFTLDFTG